ncbi:MAG: hypothetical protein WCK98_08285 [bacterium]
MKIFLPNPAEEKIIAQRNLDYFNSIVTYEICLLTLVFVSTIADVNAMLKASPDEIMYGSLASYLGFPLFALSLIYRIQVLLYFLVKKISALIAIIILCIIFGICLSIFKDPHYTSIGYFILPLLIVFIACELDEISLIQEKIEKINIQTNITIKHPRLGDTDKALGIGV